MDINSLYLQIAFNESDFNSLILLLCYGLLMLLGFAWLVKFEFIGVIWFGKYSFLSGKFSLVGLEARLPSKVVFPQRLSSIKFPHFLYTNWLRTLHFLRLKYKIILPFLLHSFLYI